MTAYARPVRTKETRTLNENDFFNNITTDLHAHLAAIDTLGSPDHYNHYAWGWANAGNTPFPKQLREDPGVGSRSPGRQGTMGDRSSIVPTAACATIWKPEGPRHGSREGSTRSARVLTR